MTKKDYVVSAQDLKTANNVLMILILQLIMGAADLLLVEKSSTQMEEKYKSYALLTQRVLHVSLWNPMGSKCALNFALVVGINSICNPSIDACKAAHLDII